jgi:hypothetical protein
LTQTPIAKLQNWTFPLIAFLIATVKRGSDTPETRQQEFREVEVITATACTDSAAKAAYFARWGTANE